MSTGIVSVLQDQDRVAKRLHTLARRRAPWIVLLALLLNFAAIYYVPRLPSLATPMPVDLTPVSAESLEKLKQQWKKLEQRPMVSVNDDRHVVDKPPPNARYDSDKNRKVERETRARRGDVIARRGGHGVPQPEVRKQMPPKKMPALSDLGVGLPKPRPQTPPASAGSGRGLSNEQNLADKNLAEGDQNVLNTQESVYYSYYARISEQIGPLWQSIVRQTARMLRLKPGSYVTVAEITLDEDGNFVGIDYKQSSGNPQVDRAVEEAWKKAPRFPNPPQGMRGEDGRVHMVWSHQLDVDESFGIQYQEPERLPST